MWYKCRSGTTRSQWPRTDIAEGLERAAVLMVRHLSNRAGLSLTAVVTLGTLEREGPVRVTILARSSLAGVGRPAMTELIQRLERQGLVTRVDDPEDGRVALVSLSAAGRVLRSDLQRGRRDRLAVLLAGLPAEDEAALNLAMRVALPIIRRLIDQAHRCRISTDARILATSSRSRRGTADRRREDP